MADENLFHELAYYTLERRDSGFIHQHAVDAFAAQNAGEETKPIALAFALVGLYLHLERGFSGRQVQQAHMQLARRRKSWPSFPLPADRGSITISEVLAAEAGEPRDAMIHEWVLSVWQAWAGSRTAIVELAKSELGIA